MSTYKQKGLSVSRVMQQFRSMAVTARVIREPGSERWLHRKHYKIKKTGFATAARAVSEQAKEAVAEDGIYNVITRWQAESMEHA